MRKKGPSADMTEVGRPNTHSVLEIVGGRLALRPRGREHGIRGDPQGARDRVVAGVAIPKARIFTYPRCVLPFGNDWF